MGLAQQVASLFQAQVNSNNILVQRWPNATAGANVTAGATPAFSAWTQIIAAAKIAATAWITGAFIENPATPAAAEVWLIDLAVGAVGVEVSLSSGTNTAQGFGSLSQASAVAGPADTLIRMPTPIRVTGQPRVTGALAGLLVGGKIAAMAFQTVTGIGT